MADINIESPNISVEAPVDVGLKGLATDAFDRIANLVDAVKQGDDEVMTALFLGLSFVVAGIFVWRRL